METENQMVYRGKPNLVHIADGERNNAGIMLASELEQFMREGVENWVNPLCPGCYMVAGFDMLVHLARTNGQSLSELGRTMSAAFAELETCGSYDEACRESVQVLLDPDPSAEPQAHGYVDEDSYGPFN